jgi:phage shock protein E
MYSGIAAALYTVYSGLKYYAIKGEGLINAEDASKYNIKHVIDVRTKVEWNLGHFTGAKHIPAGSMTAESLKGIPKNDAILVYCNTGQRARSAAEKIRSYGYKKVYYIENTYKSLKL